MTSKSAVVRLASAEDFLQKPLFEQSLILGVDPGLTGAMAILDGGQIIEVQDTPLYTRQDGKKEIDAHKLSLFVAEYASRIRVAVIEDVGAMPGQGVVSMFRFGFSTGVAHGIVASFMIPILKIKPAVWKSAMGLSRDKQESISKIKKLYPESIALFPNNKDGRAEAALLAHYGKRLII